MRFQIGSKVKHESLGLGTVLKCINNLDRHDVALQGHRYYVRFKDGTWSVPEARLLDTLMGIVYI